MAPHSSSSPSSLLANHSGILTSLANKPRFVAVWECGKEKEYRNSCVAISRLCASLPFISLFIQQVPLCGPETCDRIGHDRPKDSVYGHFYAHIITYFCSRRTSICLEFVACREDTQEVPFRLPSDPLF